MRKILFHCTIGSHLYGLNTPTSDIDFFGVFAPDEKELLGLNELKYIDNSVLTTRKNERNTNKDIDDKVFSIRKYIELLLGNNPNIIETLFIPEKNINVMDSRFKELIDNYPKFVSKRVYKTFNGYAKSQFKKLEVKSERYNALKLAINYLKVAMENNITHLSEDSSFGLNKHLNYYKKSKGSIKNFHKGMEVSKVYEILNREYDEYGWRAKTETFKNLHYDVKFAYHLVRIMLEANFLLDNGFLNFPFEGKEKKLLLSIKNGEREIDDIKKIYHDLSVVSNEIFEKSTLPDNPDYDWADNFLTKIHKKFIIK